MESHESLDDGLIAPEVGPWSIDDKLALMSMYAGIFTKAMHRKWSRLAYIDLFSGPGKSTDRTKGVIVNGSPLRALAQKISFDRLVFCEADPEKFKALEKRVGDSDRSEKAQMIYGDANERVKEIAAAVLDGDVDPRKVLALCFVDPYKIANFRFETIRTIADRTPHIDCMVLIPTGMDVRRNLKSYISSDNSLIADFTGVQDWREKWEEQQQEKTDFGAFVVNIFAENMQEMGFIYDPVKSRRPVRSSKNVPLYDLVFFSKHCLGVKFFSESIKSTSKQRSLEGF